MKKKVTILGAGESGLGAAILAKKVGFEVFVSDFGTIKSEFKSEIESNDFDFEEGKHSEEKILASDLIIKSPGIPDSVGIIQKLNSAGIEIISEPEFASRYFDGKILAITGTNGKTTTTLLSYHLLKEAGENVGLAGNVGISFARQVATNNFDIYVIEISSFQLDGIKTFRPDVAVLLNITPDHLDRYDYQMSKYIESKFRIAKNLLPENAFIYNYDDDNIKSRYADLGDFRKNSFSIRNTESEAYSENGSLRFQGNYQVDLSESPLIGKHNEYNQMAAILALLSLGIPFEKIASGLKSFKNAEHRLELVAELNGVKYINDSKATNVDAAYYAIEGIEAPIIWIAGGVDKGNDYNPIIEMSHKIKALFCLGKNNKPLLEAFGSDIEIIREFTDINSMLSEIKELAIAGDNVLLSPACASFDLFKNYEDRGNQFNAGVEKLKELG